MKILPEDSYRNKNIIPLNVTYYNPQDFNIPDVLTIVYKDLDTNQKSIYQIQNPTIEVYILKYENRDTLFKGDNEYILDCVEKDLCHKIDVKYRSRFYEIGKYMKISTEDAKTSPFVFGADLNIENIYLTEFIKEYHTDSIKSISMGYLDIENDTILTDHFPEYGTTPINMVTYIDGSTKNVYTFVLIKDLLPPLEQCNEEMAVYKRKFIEQSQAFLNNQDEFIKSLHEKFDELYPGMIYNIFSFDTEVKLMKALWDLIHAVDNDYIYVWNLPYDISNLIIRLSKFGIDPTEVIKDPRFKENTPINFEEDTNPVVHKRKHLSNTYTIPTFLDQMVLYAGIRSGRGKLPSTKLNAIAKEELQDTKYDYSETTDIRHLFYDDFNMSVTYNIKDVLLQYGIERKVADIDTIYDRIYSNLVLPHQSFTTTLVVLYSLGMFISEKGYVYGLNKNKFKNHNKDLNYGELLEEYEDEIDLVDIDYDEDEDEEEDTGTKKKKKKYQGAFVLNTLYQQPTGIKILGKPAKFIHDFVGDEDITAEYPSSININNISNDTLVGKVYLDHPDDVVIPMYSNLIFRGDEANKYKMNVSNFMLEAYSERDYIDFGNVFLNLPTVSEVLDEIDIEDILKE